MISPCEENKKNGTSINSINMSKWLPGRSSSSPTRDESLEPMEGYVDQIGQIKPKDVKQVKAAAGTVLREINQHTRNLSELEKERRAENAHPHAEGATDLGWCSKERLLFYALLVKCILSGVVFPIIDIGSDIATAYTHFYFGDVNWGLLTVTFVLLPGAVCGAAVMVKGLKAKEFNWRRTGNYLIVLALMPVLYPILVVIVNLYMVYLMIINRSREIVSIMGHDVKQFKSLEGFLEAGPQFVLQTYILLSSDPEDEDRGEQSEAKRIIILVVSITLSFLSLAKTGYNVNVPDPDDQRASPQYPESAPRFSLTSILFHLVCVLFRVTSLSLFFACFSSYTLLIILTAFGINFGIYHACGASHTMTLLLGSVSIFMPNGYLLYNFAATFPVDFAFKETRKLLFAHMLTITPLFCTAIIFIAISSGAGAQWFYHYRLRDGAPLESVSFTASLCSGLVVMGLISLVAFYIHWSKSVRPLYSPPVPKPEEAGTEGRFVPDTEETGESEGWVAKMKFWKKNDTSDC